MKFQQIISVIICALAVCGCKSTESKKSELLSLNEASTIGETSIDSQVIIMMEGNPTTGYDWEIASFDTDLLSFEGSNYVNKKMELTGNGGYYNFYFRTKSEGIAIIKLNYERPWEVAKGGRPLKSEEFKITIKSK